MQFFISLIGIAIIFRNLSLLEKFKITSCKKLRFCFIFLQLPIYFSIIFKELFIFTLIYIGIFFITLIIYPKIIMIFAVFTYEKCHLLIVDHLLMLIKAGKSPQLSLKTTLDQLNPWQRFVFSDLQTVFELVHSTERNSILKNHLYIHELKAILKSSNLVGEQLKSFREGLRLHRNLRHKSRQVTQQIRAQAITSVFIYIGIFILSWNQLDLKNSVSLMMLSMILFLTGLLSIFLIGGRIRWKT